MARRAVQHWVAWRAWSKESSARKASSSWYSKRAGVVLLPGYCCLVSHATALLRMQVGVGAGVRVRAESMLGRGERDK